MITAFLITLREGLEMALIVSVVLAYLAQTGNRIYFKNIWFGVSLATVLSLIIGAAIFMVGGALEGRNEEIFEGTAMLLAAGVLTWMIGWMKRQARTIRGELQVQVDKAVQAQSALALTLLAFIAVGREGIETVLFMFAALQTTTPFLATIGGILGLGTAFFIGYLLYKGSYRLHLRTFFSVTGILLIFFAAGLLAHGIHEFQEAGILPITIEHVWDTSKYLSEKSLVGSFLKGLFGYNANPSLLEVLSYGLYLLGSFWWYFRPTRVREGE